MQVTRIAMASLYARKANPAVPSQPVSRQRPLFGIRPLIKPPALSPGDTVAVILPATPLSKRDVRDTIRYLKQQGFKVVPYARTDWFKRHYLSDTDEARADAVNQAFANPDVKAVLSLQGGAGTFRPDFLNRLDYELIRKNPKIVTGFSDITYLHLVLQNKTGLVSFHSGFPLNEPGKEKTIKLFWNMISPKDPTALPKPYYGGPAYKCLVPGEVTGQIVGGNLSLVAASMGTPYEVDWKDKILLLENWKQDYEDIDREFSQLVYRGLWDNIKGLILGEFVHVPRDPNEFPPLTQKVFFTDLVKEAKKRGIPVGFNFPVGHGNKNYPIPLGVNVQFNSKTGKLTFLESPFSNTKR